MGNNLGKEGKWDVNGDSRTRSPKPEARSHDTRPLGPRRLVGRFTSRRGMLFLASLSIGLLVVAALGTWYVLVVLPQAPADGARVTPPASLDELATQYPQIGSILQNSKLDSVYKDFLLAYQDGGMEAAIQLAEKRGILNDQNEMVLTLELDTTEHGPLVTQLESLGIRVTAASGNLIDIAVPIPLIEEAMRSGDPAGLLDSLTELDHVIRVRFSPPIIDSVGEVETESLAVINADAWQVAGWTGKGIKIGVIDIGFDEYRDLLGTDLPDNVTVRSFTADTAIDQTDYVHGTGCAEIIHDIAPDAELFFTIYNTQAERRLAVNWIVSQGVKIISHSRNGMYGPMDGSGDFAQLVEQVASQGVLWVNSGGNYAERHYRGTFTDEDGDGFHEFAPGVERMPFEPKYDDKTVVMLNWDAWDTGDQDYDLYIYDQEDNQVVRSYNTQSGPGSQAAEWIKYKFPDSGPYYIAFYAKKITRPGVFDMYIHPDKLSAYATAEYSVGTPADARSALAVGAVYWNTDLLESYSSLGPTNDGRLKPDISAPTGVRSAAYGRRFTGTSAAAPHVAGAAALVWQANPSFSAQQVAEFLKERAVDLGEEGPDTRFGYGRLWLGVEPSLGGMPEPTATAGSESPTATQAPEQTRTATVTRSPTQTVPNILGTPTPRSASLSDNLLATPLFLLGLLACVMAPGLLGLGGLGLLGLVLYQGRQSRRRARLPGTFTAQSASALETPTRRSASPLAGDSPLPVDHASLPLPPTYHVDENVGGLCPSCQAPFRMGARFCRSCGFPLEVGQVEPDPAEAAASPQMAVGRSLSAPYCARCGQTLRPKSKFCPRCGERRSPLL